MAKFKGIVALTEEQFETLRNSGSVTVGEKTYTYSPKDTVYVTSKKTSTLTISGQNENGTEQEATYNGSKDVKVVFDEDDFNTTLTDGIMTIELATNGETQSDDPTVLYTEQDLTTEQQSQVCSNLDLSSKFVGLQTANDGELKVYCINGKTQDVCRVSNTGLGGAVARYTATGQLKSQVNPTEDTDLVRLAYIKDKLNHSQVYFGTELPSSGIGTTYLENDVFVLNNSNGTKNFYQLNYIDNSSSLSWHDMVDFEKPKWQVFAPSDLSQVLMTEVTIITSDQINFTGMDGKKVTVNGYSGDGFTSGTVVCDEIEGEINYSPAFIGSITSTRASGVFIKGSNSVTIVNVDNPEVTFSYKYLW